MHAINFLEGVEETILYFLCSLLIGDAVFSELLIALNLIETTE